MPNYPNISYPGSSGYGVRPDGTYGPMTTPVPTTTRQPYAAYDISSGRYIDITTGKPYTGKDPRTGQQFSNGALSAQSAQSAASAAGIDPNNPAQRYKPVDIVKAPDVNAAQQNLMETFRRNADQALTDFGTHLRSFQTDLTSARGLSREAQNISPTVDALTAAQGRYAGDLGSSEAEYRRAMADAAARERGVVQQANDLLPSYDTALDNILRNNLALVQGNLSRYKMGTGTPTSPGSSEARILASQATQAALPIEQAKIQRRYDILGGMALPVERELGGQRINFAGSFLPGVASSRYQSATSLPMQIQTLKQQVAGMSYQDAVRFLQAQGIPAEMQNAILSAQTGTLGQLGALEESTRYRGLQDVLGAQVANPVYYSQALPAYPNFPTRYPTTNTGTTPAPMQAPNAPRTVAPQQAPTGIGGMSYEDLYQMYGLTPEDYAYFNQYMNPPQSPNRENTPNVYQGPPGTVQTAGLIPEYAAGGVM